MATQIPFHILTLSLIFSNFIFSLPDPSTSYIIQMDLSAMPKAFSCPHNWYTSTVGSISNASKYLYTYTNVVHGFSAVLSPNELEALKHSPGYVSSFNDTAVLLETTHSPKFLGLNSLSGIWPSSNYGKDVVIGMVDSGVWPESKSYNDDGMDEIPSRWKGKCEVGTEFNSSMCNKKLIGARFFNKGLSVVFPNYPIPMSSPRDIIGHGTVTSSIAAGNYVNGASFFGFANGTASGVAPRARVAMYKAFFDGNGVISDVLVAIDQAISDGVDVLSLSLAGDGVALYQDALAIAAFAAVQKGIFVSTCTGNWGPGLRSLRNGAPWVLTVAAGTIDREFRWNVILGNGVSVMGTSSYFGNSSLSESSITYVGACEKLKYVGPINNKIVVCEDKNNVTSEQMLNIAYAPLAGAIFITNNPPMDKYIRYPALFISPQNKEINRIKDYINNQREPKASFVFQGTFLGAKPAPIVASYSARGPDQHCPFVLKPDLVAPGDLILTSWPSNVLVTGSSQKHIAYSEFNIVSGTSLASPHTAGVAALLKGAHPEWSPAAIRSAMMTTSDELDNAFQPIQEVGDNFTQRATPLASGSGHINPSKALDPGLIYDVKLEDYINFLCASNYTMNQIQIFTKSVSYNLSNPSLDLNYPSFIAYFNSNDSNSVGSIVREFQRTVTNVGGGPATYTAKLTPVNGVNVRVEPEKLVFREKNEKQSYKLSIEGPKLLKDLVAYGSLSWVENEGKHVVISPIVATSLSTEPLPW